MFLVKISGVCEGCGAELDYREGKILRMPPLTTEVRFTCACGLHHRIILYAPTRETFETKHGEGDQR